MGASELLGLLARALAAVDDDLPMPARLCQACATVLGAQSAALTVAATSHDRLTVATSDGVAGRIEDLEEMLGEGPAQVALTEDRVVVSEVDGSRDAKAFPVFTHVVGAISGPATYHAVPMHAGGRVMGVLSLLTASATLARGPQDVQFLADVVGLSLLGDLDSLDWSTRAEVHQATGMVTAQLRVAPGDALAVLRAHAFARSTTLEEVAEDVVRRRLSFTYDESNAVQTQRTEEP
ncbi:ANTAR domain-containing protein [Cellulosimicrobium sp. 22601]|uniref:ANTAR domain-containing protein n=1 Tax=unclassified Cellulosimicrobium TaxID=2624466 RepID=UPI003F824DA2